MPERLTSRPDCCAGFVRAGGGGASRGCGCGGGAEASTARCLFRGGADAVDSGAADSYCASAAACDAVSDPPSRRLSKKRYACSSAGERLRFAIDQAARLLAIGTLPYFNQATRMGKYWLTS